MKMTGATLEVTPSLFSHVGTYQMTLKLFDGTLYSWVFDFSVTVTNSAPYFVIAPPKTVKVHIYKEMIFGLPPNKDDEEDDIIITH